MEGGIPTVWFELSPRPNTVPELGILLVTDVLDSHLVQVRVWVELPPRPNTVPELGILLVTDVLDSHLVQVVPAVTDVWTRAVHSVNQNLR